MKKDNFIWGAATASYQIEGAWNFDGKTPSIWDTYTHDKRAFRNQTGDVACDHYNRYKEDVKLMAELGLQSYRFSISWSRIIPDESGKINEKGLQFYSDLVDELLRYGIRPMVTLYHWDMPEYQFRQGGLLRRGIVKDFEAYTRAVAERLGDRVKDFITINEPQSLLSGFYYEGLAPGIHLSLADMLASMHNLLLCHGAAVKVLREMVKDVKIGFAMCGWVPCPQEETEKNIQVCYDKFFSIGDKLPTDMIVALGDAVYLGDYPKEYYDNYKDILPDIQKGDMEIISQPLDYLCQNLYSGFVLDENGDKVEFYDGSPMNNFGWDDIPESLYWGCKFLYERYKLPIIITENGTSVNDRICLDGKIHDSYRIDMTARYLLAIRKAIKVGVPIIGYYHWSFMDNFEWKAGFSQRFGLVFVDYRTGERIKKDSFGFYKKVIESDGELLTQYEQ